MAAQRCPHCYQLMPEFRLGVRLTDHNARIFDLVARSGANGIAGDDLFATAYDDQRIRWRRERASRRALKAHIYWINQQIGKVGYRIVCSGRDANSTYRLEKQPGHPAWKGDRAKTLRHEGKFHVGGNP
jgi:hypothetical protein